MLIYKFGGYAGMPGSSGIHTYPPSTQLRFLKRNILAGEKVYWEWATSLFLGYSDGKIAWPIFRL